MPPRLLTNHSTTTHLEEIKMSFETQIQREEEDLEEQLASGEITTKEFNREMSRLQREYREEARESAQRAYDREMDNW